MNQAVWPYVAGHNVILAHLRAMMRFRELQVRVIGFALPCVCFFMFGGRGGVEGVEMILTLLVKLEPSLFPWFLCLPF
jgi:hypothetical protein